MQGQIPENSVERLKDVLKEGKVYIIRKFLCNQSKTTYRAVESPYIVQFSKFTIVEEKLGAEDAYPFCTYSLTAFNDIPDPGPPARFYGELCSIPFYIIPLVAFFLFLCSTLQPRFYIYFYTDVIGKITMVSDIIPVQSWAQTTPSDTRTVLLTDLLSVSMSIGSFPLPLW